MSIDHIRRAPEQDAPWLDLPPSLIAHVGDELDDLLWAFADGTVIVTFTFDTGVTP